MPDLPAPRPAARLIVWLGGAAFLASLGLTLVGFFIGMRPAAPGTSAAAAAFVDLLLFSIFAIHHTLFARSTIKQWLAARLPAYLERSLFVWVASALLIAVIVAWQPLPGRAYQHRGWSAVPHWAIVLAGLWLIARATGVIDPLQLAGIRQLRGESTGEGLQIVGPYRLVRHPIYLGWMLMFFGVPDMTWTRFLFAAVSSAYLIIAIPFEERSLNEAFGDAYAEYQKVVRWRVVPGVW